MSLLKLSLRAKYRLLRETVIILGLLEYIAMAIGVYYIGAQDFTSSLCYFVGMAISYYVSTKLSYAVMEMLVKLNSGGGK